jgi:hypothetical protein
MHIDSPLGALIPGAMLVGRFLRAPLCLFLDLNWNCALPVCSVLLPGDLSSSSFFILLPFEIPGLS